MIKKSISPKNLKLGAKQGSFEAVFATLETIDHDGDVIAIGAIKRQPVKIAAWGHAWGSLPVGRGEVFERGEEAIISGEFFTDTNAGKETYQVIKNLGELNEWSFGFDILAKEDQKIDGQTHRRLTDLRIFEVSPVMVGAGINTRLTAIKAGKGERAKAEAIALNSMIQVELFQSRKADQSDNTKLLLELENQIAKAEGSKPAPSGQLATNREVIRRETIKHNPEASPRMIEAMTDAVLFDIAYQINQRQKHFGGMADDYNLAMKKARRWFNMPAIPRE